MTEKTDKTGELLQAVLSATDERKDQALRVLRGEVSDVPAKAVNGPLLLGMSAAAKLLGISRATLWRILRAGTIVKIELFPGSYRVRREDLEALAAGKFGNVVKKGDRARPGTEDLANDKRFQQLKALADAGDECAAADLFKEFGFDHGKDEFVESAAPSSRRSSPLRRCDSANAESGGAK